MPRTPYAIGLTVVLLAAALFAPKAHGGDEPPPFETPWGLGLVAARAQEEEQLAFALEGQNHFKQRRGRYKFRQYGHAEARAEIGSAGAGLRLSATPGITLYGLPPAGGTFSNHVGIEPFGGRLALHSADTVANYYEWLPMVSVGQQWGLGGGCRLLPHVRGGGGVGNLGKSGWSPSVRAAYGIGVYFNCVRLDLAADLTRLSRRATDSRQIDLVTLDGAYAFDPSSGLKLGVRAESELSERRAIVLLRGELLGQ